MQEIEKKNAIVVCSPAIGVPATFSASRDDAKKGYVARLRSFVRDMKDVLLMAVGRDGDDDYECANG